LIVIYQNKKTSYSIYNRLKYYWARYKDPSLDSSKRRYARTRIDDLQSELEGNINDNDLSLSSKIMSDLKLKYSPQKSKMLYKEIYPEFFNKKYSDGTSVKNMIGDILYTKGRISKKEYIKGWWKN